MNSNDFVNALCAIEGNGTLNEAEKSTAVAALASVFAASTQAVADKHAAVDPVKEAIAADVDAAAAAKAANDKLYADNLQALRNTGGASSFVTGTGGVTAKQADTAQTQASSYVVTDPTDEEKSNPPLYFYRRFVNAGYKNVDAPNGPVDRAGAQWATTGNDGAQMRSAVEFVIKNYPAGTDNIQKHEDEVANPAPTVLPSWDKAKVDSVLARFDAAAGDPQMQWGAARVPGSGATGDGITYDEQMALMIRGFRSQDINNLINKYNP